MSDPALENQPVSDLRSVHTTNFPDLLDKLGISLAVSTYQANKLILVRAEGGALNTHFIPFKKPMGMAICHPRLALGTASEVCFMHNVPSVAGKLEPAGKHDACYLPHHLQVTGNIDIHEMAWGADKQLWLINTKFSCLCTLDDEHSFVPRWRPPFISALYLEDRCHLNGLGMRNGQPKYVTMLGETDTPGGWRANKADGGLLMDIDTNAVLLRGLSMPHSPRWYNDRLLLLESGNGSIAQVDEKAGKLKTIAQMPGFTRGLDFCGPLAFIGLSQIRETATFSGLPITNRLKERTCGVWVVDLNTGQTVAFLRFEGSVQEIFAVQVLPGLRFPEILEWNHELVEKSYVLPPEALKDVPPEHQE